MKHHMYLSDLYGRIGQKLREYGDAPIGVIVSPMFPDEPHQPIDYVSPIYADFNLCTTQIDGVDIKTYEPIIDDVRFKRD